MKGYKVIFWDFDGVIKDSVDVKGEAFATVFDSFGQDIVDRVREHHEKNGGVSRYEKIPLYLSWCGIDPEEALVEDYCTRFGRTVEEKVINSSWVPGVELYLKSNPSKQLFFLLSATPHDELLRIIDALQLKTSFLEIHGAPLGKDEAMKSVLERFHFIPSESLMIGDSKGDQKAAQTSGVSFLLRRHPLNSSSFKDYRGPSVQDFSDFL